MGTRSYRSARGALAAGAALAALVAGAPGCGPDPAPPPPPAPTTVADAPPPGLPPGTFFWRVVRGDRDRLDDFVALRDQVIAVLAEAARFPGRASGTASPAAAVLGAVREAFDEARRPRDLEASVAYFDRHASPAAEGVALLLVRRGADGTRALRLTLEDLATGGAVDGRIDRVEILWSPRGESPGAPQLAIRLGSEGGEIVQHVEIAAGTSDQDARYRVTAPQVTALYARVQRDLYEPLSGEEFLRLARAAPLAVRRPAPPQGTSFPAPPAAVH